MIRLQALPLTIVLKSSLFNERVAGFGWTKPDIGLESTNNKQATAGVNPIRCGLQWVVHNPVSSECEN